MKIDSFGYLAAAAVLHAAVIFGWHPAQETGSPKPEPAYIDVDLAATNPEPDPAPPAVEPPPEPPPPVPTLAEPEADAAPPPPETIIPPEPASTPPPPQVTPLTPKATPRPPADKFPTQPKRSAGPAALAAPASPKASPSMQGVYLPTTQVSYLRQVKPDYPSDTRRNHWQGTTVLMVYINASGSVDRVVLVQSSGFPVLDQAARSAQERSRFRPAVVNGVAVPSKARVPFRFELR